MSWAHTHISRQNQAVPLFRPTERGVHPMLHCLYFSDGEYGFGMWSERETAQGMTWGKEEMLESISAPSCVRFSVLRQWGEGIESHVTSLRAAVNGDGAAWIGHSVKGQNRAVPRLAYWSTRTLKIRQWNGWPRCFSRLDGGGTITL